MSIDPETAASAYAAACADLTATQAEAADIYAAARDTREQLAGRDDAVARAALAEVAFAALEASGRVFAATRHAWQAGDATLTAGPTSVREHAATRDADGEIWGPSR